jgi:CubicO group peptidase (beta-lactamase class C family)
MRLFHCCVLSRACSLGVATRLLVLATLPAVAPAAVANRPDVTAAERLFEAWLGGQMAYRGLPGVAVGVVHDQSLVWARGFGFANVDTKQPITPATKFRIASHSKLFTATAIMQLRDAGRLRLDDPVVQHLPWLKPKTAAPDDDAPITVGELLTHSSGLSREAGSHWTSFDFPDEAAVQRYVAEHGVVYAPEVRWKYSNLALAVAGLVVEKISGERYADYVQRHIFDPLGMKDTWTARSPISPSATVAGCPMARGSRCRSSTRVRSVPPPASPPPWRISPASFRCSSARANPAARKS